MLNLSKKWKFRLKYLSILMISFILMSTFVLYPLFINVWISNASDKLYSLIQSIYDKELSVIYLVLIFSLLICFLYWVYIRYKQEIEKFEQEKRETSRTLLRKYNELKEFDESRTLSIIMQRFCMKHDLVFAIQIYSYENIPSNNSMRCKIKYVDGFVKDKVDLNGMIQQNYYLNKNIYKEYTRSVSKLFDDVNKVGPLLKFISKYVKEITNKSLKDLDDTDALKFALLKDSINNLSYFYPGINDIVINSDKMKKLEYMSKDQRNGIFRGILLGGFYSFFYDGGNGTKEGRQYITNPITLSNVQYITLITLDPDLLEEEIDEKNKQLRGFIEEFEDMLHRAFESEYNEKIKGAEYHAL